MRVQVPVPRGGPQAEPPAADYCLGPADVLGPLEH